MAVLCRIGMHRWKFTTKLLVAPGSRRAEAVYARCSREGCTSFGEARLVHWDGRPYLVRNGVGRPLSRPGDVV